MTLLESEQTLKSGEPAPGFSLKATDDKTYSFDDLKGEKGTLILFMCNHCPYVIAKFDAIERLGALGKELGISVVGINSNDPEYVEEDSFQNMRKLMDEKNFSLTYLIDETQEVAKAYGAICTPDPFLFDKEGKLVFHGRIDDAMNPGDTPKEHTMEELFRKLAAGEPLGDDFKPSQGCSIKWK